MTAGDEDYYRRRVREERAAEQAAKTRDVALVHAELAAQYEELLKTLQETSKP